MILSVFLFFNFFLFTLAVLVDNVLNHHTAFIAHVTELFRKSVASQRIHVLGDFTAYLLDLTYLVGDQKCHARIILLNGTFKIESESVEHIGHDKDLVHFHECFFGLFRSHFGKQRVEWYQFPT